MSTFPSLISLIRSIISGSETFGIVVVVVVDDDVLLLFQTMSRTSALLRKKKFFFKSFYLKILNYVHNVRISANERLWNNVELFGKAVLDLQLGDHNNGIKPVPVFLYIMSKWN